MAKREKFFAVVIGILLIVNIFNYFQIGGLRDNISNLERGIMDVEHSVSNISDHVEAAIDEFLQGQTWVKKKDYQMMEIDFKKNTGKVKLEWTLSELSSDEIILLLYREEGQKEWIELEVEPKKGLNYSLMHTFSLTSNYETQVLAVSEKGKRSEELLDLSFKDDLDNRMMIDAWYEPDKGNNIDVEVFIQNELQHKFIGETKKDDFKIKSAKAFIVNGEKILKEIDLLKENQYFETSSTSEVINYSDSFDFDEELVTLEKVELHIVVKDRLGLTYERRVNPFY